MVMLLGKTVNSNQHWPLVAQQLKDFMEIFPGHVNFVNKLTPLAYQKNLFSTL